MTADERLPTVDELPDGWMWTTLGKVCQVNPRMSWPESFTEKTPVSFVPMAAVDDVTGAIVAAKPRPISEVWRGYKRFAEGDVIFARITPCMENGKAAIATGLLNGIGLGSTEFHVLRPTEAVLEKWVYHFVRQQSFRNEATREMTGTAGQLRVPKSFMEKAFIPLPPRTEQQRIVAKIEALFAQSRRGREALDAVLDLLTKFRRAVLAAAFRGALTQRNPADEPASVLLERIRAERRRKWEEDLRAQGKDPSRRKYKTLDQSFKLNRGRFSVRPRNDPRYYDGPYPFVQIGNLPKTGGEITGFTQTLNERGLEVSRMFPKGTVLIAIVGATIANTGTLTFDSCCPDSLVAIQANDEIRLRFVELYLRFKKHTIRGQSYASGGQPNINLRTLRPYPVPLPPLAEQRRIVARIEALFAQADILEAQVAATRRRLEQMDQAILARAFRGELVPQDPNDEPASVLLERIQGKREAKEAEERAYKKSRKRQKLRA